ncbi:MAG: outer membrane beta-barrel protein [Caulobacteraceae bacterium]
MTRAFAVFAPAIALAILSAGNAAAQAVDQSGPRKFEIDVIGDIIYDSNVAGVEAANSPSGIKPEDEIGRPSLALDIFLPMGREAVFLKGTAGYDFHAVNTQLNGPRIDLTGGAQAGLGPCRETLTGSYSLRQTQLYLLPYALKNLSQNGLVSFDAECGRQIGLGTTFAASEDWSGNQNPTLQIQNYRTFNVSGGLAYRRPVFGQLSLYGQYQSTDFTHRFVPVGARLIQDGYQVASGGVRYDRPIGDRMEGIVSLSYSSLEPKIPGETGYKGLDYTGDLIYRFTHRLHAHLTISHMTKPSNQPGGDYSIAQTYELDADYQMGPRLDLVLGGGYQSNDYRGIALIPVFFINHDRETNIHGSAKYKLGRRLTLGLSVQHTHRDASPAIFSYGDTRADLSITSTF